MQKYAHFVELEKCCQTHIFLQNFVLIQPRTSPPKICKILQNFANFPIFGPGPPAPDHETRPAQRRRGPPHRGPRGAAEAEAPGWDNYIKAVANFWQIFARFRLYRRRSLQINTRFPAFFKIYKII